MTSSALDAAAAVEVPLVEVVAVAAATEALTLDSDRALVAWALTDSGVEVALGVVVVAVVAVLVVLIFIPH